MKFYAVFITYIFFQSKYSMGSQKSRMDKRMNTFIATCHDETTFDMKNSFFLLLWRPFSLLYYNQSGNPVYFGDKQCFQISRLYRLHLISFFQIEKSTK